MKHYRFIKQIEIKYPMFWQRYVRQRVEDIIYEKMSQVTAFEVICEHYTGQ